MMLLDRQVGATDTRPAARFFVQDFLGAQPALDDHERTDRFYRAATAALNDLRRELTGQEQENLRLAVETAVRSQTLDVDSWLESLRLSPQQKEQVGQVVAEQLPDRHFEVDTGYGAKLTRKRRFRGDADLRLEVSADRFGQLISVQSHTEPGRPHYYEVTIRTERWDETTR